MTIIPRSSGLVRLLFTSNLSCVSFQAIRRTIDKKTVEVYQLFNEELNLVKKEFNTKTVDLPPMYPHYAGSAAWARMLKRRIDRPMNVSSLTVSYNFGLCIDLYF